MEDQEAIRNIQATYASGWNAENPQETILSIFAEDAVLLPHHGDKQVEGKNNIKRHFWPAGMSGFQVNFYNFNIMEITGNNNLAYSRGRYSISFSYDDNGTLRTLNNEGNYVMLFRKEDNEWLITHYIWNDPVPQE